MTELSLRANAKINLFLEVLDRRPDGYHNIETVFQSIDLYDIIILREDKPGVVRIRCNNPQVPLDSSNLVYRAADLLLKESGRNHGVEIRIIKRIPIGAGLAGGSTDAAATLIGLNELWNLEYSDEELVNFGGRLGADVPFCMIGGTALGKERGDQITRLAPFPEASIVLANPGFQVSTAWAYGSLASLGLTRTKKSANILIEKIQQDNLLNIGNEFFNIFEFTVLWKYPQLRHLKENFLQSGAIGTLMTGSGPTVFALARDITNSGYLYEKTRKLADFCVITKTSDVSITKM